MDDQSRLRIHGFTFDLRNGTIAVGGESIALGRVEFGILLHLARNAGIARSRKEIIDAVQGPDYPVTERSVDVQIAGLRRKLGPRAEHIETVRGQGYRFHPDALP